MTILADFLRDNYGNVIRIYPSVDGELYVSLDQWGSSSGGWSEPTYVIPTEGYEYRTLADSDGTTWYVYLVRIDAGDEVHWEITISNTAPTAQPAGMWRGPKYGGVLTETAASVGDEIYLAFRDVNSTSWYVYPNASGELIISTTVPA